MTIFRAALCGLGNIAWLFDEHRMENEICLSHAGAYQRQEKTNLVAGFSPMESDRDAFQQAFALPAYHNFEDLLAFEKPDIVSICSPSQVHFEQVMACLDHGVPMIWLEKPPTLTLSETDILLAKINSTQSTVLVNYQRRYLPIYQELRRRFLSRLMGECRQVHVTYSRGLETNGSHIVDIIFFLLEEQGVSRLQLVSDALYSENPSFGMTVGGIEVVVTGLALPYHNVDISITCDAGRISVLHGGMTGVIEGKIEHELFPGFYRLETQDDNGFSALAGLGHGMENALQDLLDAHAFQRLPASSLQSARRTMALVEDVRRWQSEKVAH